MDESVYWAHLASTEGLGSAIFDELVKRFGSIKRALEAPVHEVKEIPSMDERTAEAICRAAQTLASTRARIGELAVLGVQVKTKLDNSYPSRLRQAANPPPVIYLAGAWQPSDDMAVAIIGSRDCSAVSAKRAREYAQYFARQGLTIVSGYADGVDVSAHLGALEAGGRTIIIPGCGADHFDFGPLSALGIRSFAELSRQAIWVSEQPPQAGWSNPGSLARNRLVAAWARAVLVIEARLQSSTLDTVEKARALGRPIFAQSFASVSQRVMGNEKLLREGAGTIQGQKDLEKITALVKGNAPAATTGKRAEDPRR